MWAQCGDPSQPPGGCSPPSPSDPLSSSEAWQLDVQSSLPELSDSGLQGLRVVAVAGCGPVLVVGACWGMVVRSGFSDGRGALFQSALGHPQLPWPMSVL